MTDKIEQCTKMINDSSFFIIDDKEKEPPYLVYKNGEFEVINQNKKELSFISIDSCVYDSKDDTRCDCAIYDEVTFCFIELKHCKRTAWKRHRAKAEDQLKKTIETFEEEGITKDKKLEAFMSCNCTIDSEYTKIKRISNKFEVITYFKDNLNTDLYCDTKKEFK